MTDETKKPQHWSRAAMAEMSELKSQVKELLIKLESSEADFMFAYETANSYQDRLMELEEKCEQLQHDNEHLYKVNAEFGEKYSKDRAIISHLEKEYDKLALYNDALVRERDIQHRINKGVLGDVRELTQKLNEVTQSEDPRITKIHDMVAEHFETSGIPVIDRPSVEHLIYVHQQDRKRIEELEEGIKNLSGALINKADAERKDTDTITKFFKSYEIDLYPSVESLIQAFERSEELYSRAFNSMNEEIRELRHSKIPEVDWTRFVSWDELSRMTINEIMEKVHKNG